MFGNGEVANEANALWRSCAEWLIRCGVLDRNHRVNWPNSTILEFAQILRDGVLLCQAVNNLSRGCVDLRAVNLRPQLSQVFELSYFSDGWGTAEKSFSIMNFLKISSHCRHKNQHYYSTMIPFLFNFPYLAMVS